MKKTLGILFGLIITISFLTTLTGCIGYHPCNKRGGLNQNYIEDYAQEYGLTDYINYHSFFMDVETVAEFITGERVSVTPEQNHRVLIEHENYLIKFLFITDCTQDDIYYYEVYFPYYSNVVSLLEEYELDQNLVITVFEEDIVYGENYGYLDAEREGYYSPISYVMGSYIENEISKNIYVVVTSEKEYSVVATWRVYNEEHHLYERVKEVLFDFTLEDIATDLD